MKTSSAEFEPPAARNYGPCLYLGPTGQRCDRPAGEDGFCQLHGPEGAGVSWKNPIRVIAALLLLLATIWPLLAHFFSEITGRPR